MVHDAWHMVHGGIRVCMHATVSQCQWQASLSASCLRYAHRLQLADLNMLISGLGMMQGPGVGLGTGAAVGAAWYHRSIGIARAQHNMLRCTDAVSGVSGRLHVGYSQRAIHL